MYDTKPEDLKRVLRTHKILADTSFLLQKGFASFIDQYREILSSNPILVPKRVLEELIILRQKRRELVSRINDTLELLNRNQSLIDIRGEPSDSHCTVDQVLSRVVEQHIGRVNLLILTNDRALANWLYGKKRSPCFRTNSSLLVAFFPRGATSPKIWRDTQDAFAFQSRDPGDGWCVAPFALPKDLAPDLETPLVCKIRLSPGDFVQTRDGTRVQLAAELASGGEGTVFQTNQTGLVCKIYHEQKLTVGKKNKVELMTTRRIPDSTICWPTEPVYDADGVFRGFLMPEARGEPLARGLFIPKAWLQKHPSWTRRESVRLALTILKKIKNIHTINVLLGDINPFNILVVDPDTVYFVDCDSYQVEGFPCPVGSINFVAPEIQGKDFRQFLRTLEHELFAVATLLFMIMVPGKSPYSHQGGTDGADNIRKMHFPYPFKTRRAENIAMGPWRFCWSHLSPKLKEAFYRSFHKDYRNRPRVTVDEWIRLFEQYKKILDNPQNVFKGPRPQLKRFDLDILPQNYYYTEKNGTIVPKPLPPDGKTDLILQREFMLSAVLGHSPSTKKQPAQTIASRPRTPSQFPTASQVPKKIRHPRTSPSVQKQKQGGWGYTIGGGIVGAIVGSFGGPVGMLVGGIIGAVIGRSIDQDN